MIQDILKKLGTDKAENRNIIETAINDSLKDDNNPARTHLLTLELGAYLNEDEKPEFFKTTRPQTYLKLYGIVRDLMNRRENEKALEIINATLDYITKQPVVAAPNGVDPNSKRYQFNSFAEMLIYCTKYPKESCLWVAKDESAFAKLKGYLLIEKKQYQEAREVLEHLTTLNPLDLSSILEIFETYKLEGNLDKAFECLNRVYKDVWYIEDYGRMLRGYGFYYLEKGDYEKAQAYYLTSLMYDSSVEADKYVSNELNIIKEKMGAKFQVLPPHETAKFMVKNNLPYLLSQETEVTLMRVLKKLYELKLDADKKDAKQAEFMKATITSFEANLKRVTLNKKELIEVVKTDVYTNMFMYVNSFFRYSFKLDKVFRQMPPQNLAKNEETRNILSFLYRTNDKNLVEGFPITVMVDKIWTAKETPENEKHSDLVDNYVKRLEDGGFKIESRKDLTLENLGIPATKLVVTKDKETRCTYLFNISPRAFGLISSQVEYDGDINDSYLTEMLDTWDYLTYNSTRIAEILDKAHSGYHSLLVNGAVGTDKLLRFASELEFMLARVVPIQNRNDAIWEITGRKIVVGYILKELKMGVTRENLKFDKLRNMLSGEESIDEYFKNSDEVIGYYTKAALTSDEKTKASYLTSAKDFLLELEK